MDVEALDDKFDPQPRRWWFVTSIGGMNVIAEIATINGEEVGNLGDAPKINRDDVVVVDRVLAMFNMGYGEYRMALGPIFAQGTGDFHPADSRRPLTVNGASLLIGPHTWLDYNDASESVMQEAIEAVYGKKSAIIQPENAKPIVPGPSAMQALGQIQP